jgi:hypothetical protein
MNHLDLSLDQTPNKRGKGVTWRFIQGFETLLLMQAHRINNNIKKNRMNKNLTSNVQYCHCGIKGCSKEFRYIEYLEESSGELDEDGLSHQFVLQDQEGNEHDHTNALNDSTRGMRTQIM